MVKFSRSNLWHDQKGLVTRNVHVKYESFTSNSSKEITKVKFKRNVGHRSRSRSRGRPWCHLKGVSLAEYTCRI